MIALGIDPGTDRVGYGIVRKEGGTFSYIDAGILAVSRGAAHIKLRDIKRGVDHLFATHAPQACAIEKLFFAKNQKTALRVAEARGVLLLSIADAGVPLFEYAPNEVKLGIAGDGSADKRAVLKMVRLTLREPALSVIDDASDALALAILACGERNLDPV